MDTRKELAYEIEIAKLQDERDRQFLEIQKLKADIDLLSRVMNRRASMGKTDAQSSSDNDGRERGYNLFARPPSGSD